MKQIFSLCQQKAVGFLLMMFMGVICVPGNTQVVSKKLIPKAKVQTRMVSNSLPQGYRQLGLSDLYYYDDGWSVDVIGKFGNDYYSSTYSNGGYRSAMKVDQHAAVSGDFFNGVTNNGVTVKIELKDYNGLAQFNYIVTNTNDAERLLSLGSYADVMIGNNDRAPIVRKRYLDGSTYGLQMKNSQEEITASLVLLFGTGMDGITPVDDFWFGYYGNNNDYEEIAGNYYKGSNYNEENGSYDSGLGWCWKNRVLPPNSTTVYSVLLGVGDVTLLPMIQQLDVTTEDVTQWNDLSLPHTFKLSGTYFSPAGHKGQLYYSVDDEEWQLVMADSLRSEAEFEKELSVTFKPNVPVHTIRVCVKDQVGANSPYYTIRYRDVSSLLVSGLEELEYTGEPLTHLELVFSDPQNGETLVVNHQYALSYADNVNAGEASIHVQGAYPYSIGNTTLHFNIKPAELSGELSLTTSRFSYTGSEIIPEVKFVDSRFGELSKDTDYTLSFENNKYPGNATVKLVGKGNFIGEITTTFEITKKPVEKDDLVVSDFSEVLIYDGKPHPITFEALEGLGNYTVYYIDEQGHSTQEAPVEPGKYSVTIVFEEGTYFESTSIENAFSFTIEMMETISGLRPSSESSLSSNEVEFSWENSTDIFSYAFYLWKVGSTDTLNPVVSGLQKVRYTERSLCDYGKSYAWKVYGYDEKGIWIAKSQTNTFSIQEGPNLHVTNVECSEAWAGQKLTVTWTVKNDGLGTTGENTWKDKIWVVSDISEGLNVSSAVTVENVKALASGESYTNTAEISIGERVAGDYYVMVAADMNYIYEIDWSPVDETVPAVYTPSLSGTPYSYLKGSIGEDKVGEAGELDGMSDNFFYKRINVQIPELPDLQVLSVVSPEQTFSGQEITVQATITNKGVSTKENVSWCDEVFISQEEAFNSETARALRKAFKEGTLAKDGTYTVMFNVRIPADYEGDYYFFVKTNVHDNIYEHAGIENNVTRSEKPIKVISSKIPADLQTVSLEVTPQVIGGTDLLTVKGKVKNIAYRTENNYWVDDVYASLSANGLDASAIRIGQIAHYGVLDKDEEYEIEGSCSVELLDEGTYYIYLKVDGRDYLYEDGKVENNVMRASSTVQVKHVDLAVTAVSIPDAMSAGYTYPISWTVQNTGADLLEYELPHEVQILDEEGNRIKSINYTVSLSVKGGETVTVSDSIYMSMLPKDGAYQIVVNTNSGEALLEHNKNNNLSNPVAFQYTRRKVGENGEIEMAPIKDLAISSRFPSASVLTTGKETLIYWQVENLGEDVCQNWQTRIYVSDGKKKIFLQEVAGSTLQEGEIYNGEILLAIPHAYHSMNRLILETDVKDANSEDNSVIIPVELVLGPTPDLYLKQWEVSPLVAGQKATVTYEVENIGAGSISMANWHDVVALSGLSYYRTRDNVKEIFLSNQTLKPGDSYKQTVYFVVPSDYLGNYTLFLKVNHFQNLFEGEEVENNMGQKAVQVTDVVVSETPTDLQVSQVTAPTSFVAGEEITISWTVENVGTYAANGKLKEAIYFSEDKTWDMDDLLVGTVTETVAIESGKTLQRRATGMVQNVIPGSYYVLVRTNQLNSIKETDYSNNAAVSAASTQVDFKELAIGGDQSVSGQGFYRLAANEGETLLLHLESDGTEKGFALYVAHEKVPTPAVYDYSAAQPNDPFQEILIPEMKAGTYYILAQQQDLVSGTENNFSLEDESDETEKMQLSLSAEQLQFSITRVDKSEGGSEGTATSKIQGAKFDSIMDYRLKREGLILPAEAVYFQNSSESLVSFNLNEVALGTYDVVVEKQGGVTTEMKAGYTVVQGTPNKLLTRILAPATARSGNRLTITIEYSNNGLTDVSVSEFLVTCEGEHYLAMNVKDLEKRETELRIPLNEEGTNLPLSVAPGEKGTVHFYINIVGGGTAGLQLYIIP